MSPPKAEPLVDELHRLFTMLRTQVSAALAPVDVHFAQYVCLQMLSTAPDQSNADLARVAGVTPQAMNGVVLRMQQDGLIDRPDSVSFGRARPASLTAYGRRTLKRADAAVRAVEEQVLSVLTDDERNGLHAALRALAASHRTSGSRRSITATNSRSQSRRVP
ncbi:MarR family winged helix-turn-helix transcriptional regulator [Mycolicibacterium moriokaense]|uniref:DNA-binding MarR family transcriptional regulator n=1 Tax=Mycolicibacterium moriokaense TaxID=39691 RepID=A0A318H730_9MYCO|nr:MarR family transcriptional regulator [Mycolicibacterium moriokaense]PXX00305.1 DNA-binding MarR family transcriptional regulator [Mycolicibacterium moriokaense]